MSLCGIGERLALSWTISLEDIDVAGKSSDAKKSVKNIWTVLSKKTPQPHLCAFSKLWKKNIFFLVKFLERYCFIFFYKEMSYVFGKNVSLKNIRNVIFQFPPFKGKIIFQFLTKMEFTYRKEISFAIR